MDGQSWGAGSVLQNASSTVRVLLTFRHSGYWRAGFANRPARWPAVSVVDRPAGDTVDPRQDLGTL